MEGNVLWRSQVSVSEALGLLGDAYHIAFDRKDKTHRYPRQANVSFRILLCGGSPVLPLSRAPGLPPSPQSSLPRSDSSRFDVLPFRGPLMIVLKALILAAW
jgi:hypothetical protein